MSYLPPKRKRERSGILRAAITPFDAVPAGAEWRLLPINDHYEVSDYGHLRRAIGGSNTKRGKIMRPAYSGSGKRRIAYVKYTISRDGKESTLHAHRLVALTFLGPPPTPQHQVAHDDGNGLNYHVDNLIWKLPKENSEDKRRHGTLVVGERVNTNRLTAEQVIAIRGASGTQQEIANRDGVRQTHISNIKLGKAWRHLL